MPKLSKIAKVTNMGVSTLVDLLAKQGITVEANPNARIDNAAVETLASQIRDAGKREQLQKLIAVPASRPEPETPAEAPKPEPSKPEPAADPVVKGPKVIGKVELDKHGNVKVGKPEPKPEPQPEIKSEPKPAPKPETPSPVEPHPGASAPSESKSAPKSESKPAPKPEPKPAPKSEPNPAPKPESKPEPKSEPKPEPQPEVKPAPKPEEKPEPKAEEAQNEEPKPVDEAPASTPRNYVEAREAQDTEVFRPATNAEKPGLKVVGKIDLSAFKEPARGKKKKGGAKSASGANGQQQGANRRKRIGQKVDIEQAVKQPGFGNDANRSKPGERNGQGGGNRGARGDRNNQRGNQRGPRGAKPEVSAEDVQKQVRETLARLTNKTTKRSVKYRHEKREQIHDRERNEQLRQQAEAKVLKLTEFVTANDLAQMMDIPVNSVIATCMNLGVMVSINQRLDAETINIVAEEFGFTTEYVSADVSEAIATEEDNPEDLLPRPPIVTVMGHVDHGKTSLLDYIRQANVIAGEAGGITQHIGAYSVKLANGRHITFLDTPGHEAFTAMRARGAKVTDLAIIIVAADDAVMPQTVEAINHASAAGVPIVFAINKIDKPHANPEKIKEELSAMNYLVEDWGGKYQSQDISAKKGLGVDELMEKVLLEAEMLDLKANPNRNAIGSIIESSLDKGRGYVATVLVQNGTLHVGDVVLAGTHYGKIRAMFNERNQRVKEAGPATPVLVLGLNGAPTAGDTFNVMNTEQEAREIASRREQLQREQLQRTKKLPGLDDIADRMAKGDFHELNLVVKGDVDGSVEALSDSLIKLSTPEVRVNVLHKGVGAISESDVTLAAASGAIIIGFQVRPSGAARREAEKDGVEIRLYSVIYKAIEEVRDAMEGMLSPEIKEEITGTAEVLQTYHISKIGTIAGCMVREGRIKRGSKVRLIRDGIVVYTGDLASLKRFKDDVKDVVAGYECGLSIAGYNDVRVGDMVEGFEEIEVKKTLSAPAQA